MENNRVLITTASTGQGHNAVATSLRDELEALGYQVMIIEPLKEKSENLGKFIDGGYKLLATKLPLVYSGIYKVTNTETVDNKVINKMIVNVVDKTLLEIIKEYDPALIISTHPLLVKPIADMKQDGEIHSRFVSIVTDFLAHQAYIHNFVDAYIVGSRPTKIDMVKKGVEPDKIFTYGIPIRRNFTDTEETLRKSEKFTVLVMGGSMGLKGVKKSVKNLLELDKTIKIIAICASNEELRKDLEEIKSEYDGDKELEIYGYTNQVNELMAISDVIVTKPGGLTVTEALNMKLPMIIPYYIPGQEEENTQIMLSEGVALEAEIKEIYKVVNELIEKPSLKCYLLDNIKELTKSYSIDATLKLLQELIDDFCQMAIPNKKVDFLILTASYGNGHISVANSITQQILEQNPNVIVKTIDFFKVMSPNKQKGMYDGYKNMIKYATPIFNSYYYAKEKLSMVKRLDTFDLITTHNFYKYIEELSPKAVISVFPVCAGYVSKYKEKKKIDIKSVTVITDILATNEWIYPSTDLYCVATEKIKQEMIEKGVDSEKIFVSGIPLKKEFYNQAEDNITCDIIEKIPKDKKIITFLGGGFGLLPIDLEIYKKISLIENVHLIIITGTNEKLYNKLIAELNQDNITVLGFVNDMYPIMKNSKLIIGKPGGITLFEAIMINIPFIMYKPSLGQEKENSKYVIENEIGFSADNEEELYNIVTELIQNDNLFNNVIKNLKNLINGLCIGKLGNKLLKLIGEDEDYEEID